MRCPPPPSSRIGRTSFAGGGGRPDAAFDALARVPTSRPSPRPVPDDARPWPPATPPNRKTPTLDAQWRRPARILSWTSALAAAAIRHLDGLRPVEPIDDLGFAANFLYQTLGRIPPDDEVRAFEASLIVQAEHGLHAAAFAALVVISTGADLGSAVLAGMGALSGARHGGANQLAFEMMAGFEDADQARTWARDALARGHRFPGFGHRVYRVSGSAGHSPRTARRGHPRNRTVWSTAGRSTRRFATRSRSALAPKGIYANVDSITGLLYHPMGLPVSAFPIPFCLAIQTGWMAHCLEYLPDGPMIEPGAVYVGSADNS